MTINTNQIKLINRVYSALAYRLDNRGNRRYMSELFDIERDYEKRHRAFTGRQNYGKLTMALAALDDLSLVEVYEFKALAYHELINGEG